MTRAPLFTSEAVLSFRHLPTWLLLCLAAGLVNAGAFLAVQRFASHVTGTVSQAGMAAGWTLVGEYGLVLCCFVLGAFLGVLPLVKARATTERGGVVHAVPLILVTALLTVTGLLGELGHFGPFGRTAAEPEHFVFLSLLAFAMGLQNAAVATSTGLLVRTTHLTGPATDLGINLATAVHARGEQRSVALRGAMLRAGKILSFCLGGALMVPLAATYGHAAFLVPALVVATATAASFVPTFVPRPTPNPQGELK